MEVDIDLEFRIAVPRNNMMNVGYMYEISYIYIFLCIRYEKI